MDEDKNQHYVLDYLITKLGAAQATVLKNAFMEIEINFGVVTKDQLKRLLMALSEEFTEEVAD